MAYHVSFDGPMLMVRLSGTLTAADLEGLAVEILEIERNGTNTPSRLIDLRDLTDSAVGYAEMAHLAERSRARPLAGSFRAAMLVAQPVQMGFARMFQTLNEHPRITMHIFEDEAAAREWLAGDPGNSSGGKP